MILEKERFGDTPSPVLGAVAPKNPVSLHSIAGSCDIIEDNLPEEHMSLTLIDRFHPDLRQKQQAAIDAGHIRKLDELDLLDQQRLYSLARLSVLTLGIGTLFFAGLNIAAYYWQRHTLIPGITGWGFFIWLLLNCLSYVVILPLHEVIHGLAFAFWGGKPYYGARLPFVLYCSTKGQLFRRNQYLVVGLAPLVVITLAGIVFTLLAPALAAYTLFGTIGNFSGAAGDVWMALRLLRQPDSVLAEDTEVGYRLWEIQNSPELNSPDRNEQDAEL